MCVYFCDSFSVERWYENSKIKIGAVRFSIKKYKLNFENQKFV